jgi:cytochrome c556
MISSKLLIALAALALGAAASPAVDKDKIIHDRQALMKRQGNDLRAVKGYIDGKVDQAKAIAATTDLTRTMQQIPAVFPPGSEGPSPDGKYRPKPAVWSDWQGFLARRDTAAGKVNVLFAAVKSGDKAKVRTAFADLGKNGCGACHGKFREKVH